MSCNGCRVLRKGCSESCILRPCLQWIDGADAQGHATVFVAKFFGRAGLMGFINAVPEIQRPALFQSLLYEACGRTVNPVFGAVGLLWSGNWQICQAAVETVLKGGSLKPPSSCAVNFSGLAQGPLHPAFPGEEKTSASSGRENKIQSPDCLAKESAHEIPKMRIGMALNAKKVKRTDVYDGKDDVEVNTREDLKGDVCKQQEWPKQQRTVNHNTSQVITWHEPATSNQGGGQGSIGFAVGATGLQVLAPVPRRGKPNVLGKFGTYDIKSTKERSYDDQETVVGSTDHLDLGLTLRMKDIKGEHTTGLKRVYSPSCESVNSEGSVTSLDTTPRHAHQLSFSAEMFAWDNAHMRRKLLPLLL